MRINERQIIQLASQKKSRNLRNLKWFPHCETVQNFSIKLNSVSRARIYFHISNNLLHPPKIINFTPWFHELFKFNLLMSNILLFVCFFRLIQPIWKNHYFKIIFMALLQLNGSRQEINNWGRCQKKIPNKIIFLSWLHNLLLSCDQFNC